MDVESIFEYLLAKPGASEGTPFGPQAIVFKIADKVFALIGVDAVPARLTLKCDPDRALDLRELHDAIQPGYHMNKRHWNTITLDGSLPGDELRELIEHSYDLVLASLPRALRDSVSPN